MSKTATVVFLQNSNEDCLTCAKCPANEFNVILATTDYKEALEAVKVAHPDYLVTPLFIPHADGLFVIKQTKILSQHTTCIVFDYAMTHTLISVVTSEGADYFVIKSAGCNVLFDIIANHHRKLPVPSHEKVHVGYAAKTVNEYTVTQRFDDSEYGDFEDKQLDETIRKIFLEMGIPANLKGFGYLCAGVYYTVNEPSIMNSVTKRLYPAIAEKYKTTTSKVERAIRHAIDVAWNKRRTNKINSMLGVQAFSDSEKPTSSELIAIVADRLIMNSFFITDD